MTITIKKAILPIGILITALSAAFWQSSTPASATNSGKNSPGHSPHTSKRESFPRNSLNGKEEQQQPVQSPQGSISKSSQKTTNAQREKREDINVQIDNIENELVKNAELRDQVLTRKYQYEASKERFDSAKGRTQELIDYMDKIIPGNNREALKFDQEGQPAAILKTHDALARTYYALALPSDPKYPAESFVHPPRLSLIDKDISPDWMMPYPNSVYSGNNLTAGFLDIAKFHLTLQKNGPAVRDVKALTAIKLHYQILEKYLEEQSTVCQSEMAVCNKELEPLQTQADRLKQQKQKLVGLRPSKVRIAADDLINSLPSPIRNLADRLRGVAVTEPEVKPQEDVNEKNKP